MSNLISRKDFLKAIEQIHSTKSVSGVVYSSIRVNGFLCKGIRESTQKEFRIDLDKLYQAYSELDIINTVTLKQYVDRVQSPALAILKTAEII